MKRPDVNLALVGALVAVVVGFIIWAPPGLPWDWGSLRPTIDEDVLTPFMTVRLSLDELGGDDRAALAGRGIDRDDVVYCQGAVMALEYYFLHYTGGSPSPDEKLGDILNLGGCRSLREGGHLPDNVNDWWDEYWHSS